MEVSPEHLLAFFAPDQDPRDHHLRRARSLLERAIRQRWADGMIQRDTNTTAWVERLMRATTTEVERIADVTYDPQHPIGELAVLLGLSPTEIDLLALLLAIETDPAAARLVAYLAGSTTPALTIDTLFEIVYRARCATFSDAQALLYSDLASDHAARRLQFIIVEGTETRPFLAQTVRLHPRLTAWLLGRRGLAAELAPHVRLLPPEAPVEAPDPQVLEKASHALFYGRLLSLRGLAGTGRELVFRALAHAQGRPLLVVSGRGLEPDLIVAAFREAVLHDAILAFRNADDAFAKDGLVRFRDCLAVYPRFVGLTGLDETAASVSSLRTTVEIDVAVPKFNEREALWRHHLGPGSALKETELAEISGLYNLGIGGIVDACARATELANTDGTGTTRLHVSQAIRLMFESDLAAVARRAEVSQTWDDVVLTDDMVESIRGLIDRIAYRNEVLGDWGFARKVGKGLGLTALFSGQPGTGKSMVAGLIARELGLDLYVVDLSRVMSKWLGETEKNLARAFDAAETGHVMLLFDEADTVLGKRSTSMQSANDRHANLETNFILSRLEAFQGIAIFTTNIPSAIDAAVMRRMSAHIAFPFPDVEARAELWRRMIPAETPTAGAIDFGKLAKSYELSGGYIRNVVLRAAYAAAREGTALGAAHLERAARGEYGERGALSVGGRL